MNHFIIFVAFAALVSFTTATKFSDCGSTTGEVSSVEVSDCPDSQDTCILKRGTQAGITLNFKSKGDTKTLTTVVHGIIASIPMPFPLPQPDACQTGVSCPVKNGQSYTYSNKLNIRNSYPPVSVTVRWELVDENKADTVCVEIPCSLE